MQEQFKFCLACGARNYAGVDSCHWCRAPIPTLPPVESTQSKQHSPMGALAIIFAFVLGVTALSLVASAIFPDKASPATGAASNASDYGKSAARERLENKVHTQAIVMLGLENTTVITSQDKLLVKIPRLTERDVLLESENYRPILRAWMNTLKADFAAAGVTNVCVYASAWDGLKICAR